LVARKLTDLFPWRDELLEFSSLFAR
jgi:hypothetical protein